MLERTPLHAVHLDLGATLGRFAGFELPLRYHSDLAEHRAVRERAGLFDLGHMGELEVRGPAAPSALDHALVGDFSALPVGGARYSLICDENGGILDDLVGYRLADDRYLLVVNAANRAEVRGALLDRTAHHDVEVVDASSRTALLAVQGPASAELLGPLTASDLGILRRFALVETQVAGIAVLLARTGYTGEDGFEMFCDREGAVPLWSSLITAGAAVGLEPCGLASRDTLRLEAGMRLYGQELTKERTPYEAGLGRLVALGKDVPFVGRAALASLAESEPVRALVGLVGSGRRAPRHGYDVLTEDGRVVGTVTSGALSPTLGVPIAMAYVPFALATPGTVLGVDLRGRPVPVEVVALPFHRRD